ncbi:MAG: rRNA maturation RNase YbeY [Planctomycetota bacterium]
MSEAESLTEITIEYEGVPIDPARVEQVVRATFESEGAMAFPVSIAFVDDQTIEKVNVEFLEHEGPTDVITFDLGGHPTAPGDVGGELVISPEYALGLAGEERAADETLLYVCHGILHLLGHDDHEDEEARAMHERALAILAPLGIHPAGYREV